MPSMLTIYLDAADRHGVNHPDVQRLRSEVPAWQWKTAATLEDYAKGCPERMCGETPRRPANALNVEVGTPQPRCRLKSPDGRGGAWLLSGGSPLAYGVCSVTCPMLR